MPDSEQVANVNDIAVDGGCGIELAKLALSRLFVSVVIVREVCFEVLIGLVISRVSEVRT